MAIAVASLQENGVTSNTSLTITKPTGLSVGDALVATIYSYDTNGSSTTINTPTGWEATQNIENSAAADTQRMAVFVKIADSGDVAASNFTFTTANTNNIYGAVMRVTGSRTDDLYGVGDTFSLDDVTNPQSYTVSATPAQDEVLLIATHAIASNESWSSSSDPVINGTNPTWTNRGTLSTIKFEIFTARMETAAAITSIEFTAGASSFDTVGTLTAIYGQQDASTTLTLTETSQTAFAPAGQAGAQTSLTLTETTNEAFAPTGVGYQPTRWTTTTKS